MIYLNQIGATELGRGKTLELAIANANAFGFDITEDDLKRDTESKMDGDIYWTDEPQPD